MADNKDLSFLGELKYIYLICPPKGKSFNEMFFVTKIVLAYFEKKCSSDREKLLKLKAEDREFAKSLRSLEQCMQIVKGQNKFW